MPGHDIIVVGASSGGVEVLTQLVRDLPSTLPAAIFIVLHVPAHGTSVLPEILNRTIKKRKQDKYLHALHPQDGEAIQLGRIYIAPPDQHLLLKDGYIRLTRGPKENSHRPAVDPLFRTAARVYGRRVVAVVLSGALDDGTAGLVAVKERHGVAIVQNPEEALLPSMPSSAIENVEVDHILKVSEIADLLVTLSTTPVAEVEENISEQIEIESDIAELELAEMHTSNRPGTPAGFGCPECGGSLWELQEGKIIRFRCRTGHAYSTNSLLAEQSDAMEEALWVALRALEEKAALTDRLAARADAHRQNLSAKRFKEQAEDCQKRATIVRQLLLKNDNNGQSTANNYDRQNLNSNLVSTIANSSKLTPQQDTATTKNNSLVAITGADGEPTISLLSALPSNLNAALILLDITPSPSQLAHTLSRDTHLTAKVAETGDLLQPGIVYVTPPDQHLLVNPDGTICITKSELVHFARPSADLLFESVATSFKNRAIAVVLAGSQDGAMGLQAIKKMGGITIVQEQVTAVISPLPAAIENSSVDLVLPLNEIAPTLIKLVQETAE